MATTLRRVNQRAMSHQSTDRGPTLYRWRLVVPGHPARFIAPGAGTVAVLGAVRGDPRYQDGATIVTSGVVELDVSAGIVHTRHSTYRLSYPDDEFVAWTDRFGFDLEAYAVGVATSQGVRAPNRAA